MHLMSAPSCFAQTGTVPVGRPVELGQFTRLRFMLASLLRSLTCAECTAQVATGGSAAAAGSSWLLPARDAHGPVRDRAEAQDIDAISCESLLVGDLDVCDVMWALLGQALWYHAAERPSHRQPVFLQGYTPIFKQVVEQRFAG